MSAVDDCPRRPRDPIDVNAFAGAVLVVHAVWLRKIDERTMNS